jgi:hypothetical protein
MMWEKMNEVLVLLPEFHRTQVLLEKVIREMEHLTQSDHRDRNAQESQGSL